MRFTNNHQAFFSLVKAGLWEKDIQLKPLGEIDFSVVLKLSEEQSLVGLIAGGLEHVTDIKAPKPVALQFIGTAIQLEQQNKSLNDFIGWLVERLREENVHTLLVKGQGVGQCYERPLWRASGDVDFILDEENYQRGKLVLSKVARSEHEENPFDKHYSVDIEGFIVELHGTMRSMLTKKADDYIDALQVDLFKKGRSRVWNNNGVEVFLPCPDDDVIFVFTHILKHFFNYGIGLRQFCDWSRLVYRYHNELDLDLLDARLNAMGLMTEWKVFGALAVDYLGMPSELMPFYSSEAKWSRKATRVISLLLETGNFGHNRDNDYYDNSNAIVRGIKSFWRHTCDSVKQSFIFPVDALKIWSRVLFVGIGDAVKGE